MSERLLAAIWAVSVIGQPSAAQSSDPSPHEVLSVTVAPGVQLEVLDWGGMGTPLVFLAGDRHNAHVFDHFAPRFVENQRVYGVTRRGHGGSSWPESGYDGPRRVADLEAVLDSLGLDRVILAGHSLGGEEITAFASEHPDRVSGLIYIDAGHDYGLFERLDLPGACPFTPEVVNEIFRRFQDLDAFQSTQLRDGGPWVSSAWLRRGEDASAPSTRTFSQIQAPTLGIFHVPERVADLFFGLEEPSSQCVSGYQQYVYEAVDRFAAEIHEATIVALQDTQHNIHLVSPDRLERVMKSWLAALSQRASR